MEERFYLCNTCGNVLIAAIASGVAPYCCGKEMTLLKPNTSDGNHEKHVPVITLKSENKLKVKIGSKPHPMSTEHNIRFVCLQTTSEIIVRYLKAEDAPEVCIRFTGKPVAVYSYCNIHGLWRADVPNETVDCNNDVCNVM